MESIWSEINEYEDENTLFIDAWETDDENETGKVIAKINKDNGEVNYLDVRAKTDIKAQEFINEILVAFKLIK